MKKASKLSLFRILLLSLVLGLSASNVQAMNFNWLYNTPAKKVILGGTALVGIGAAAYYFYNNSGNAIPNANTTATNSIREVVESAENHFKDIETSLELSRKTKLCKTRLQKDIVLLNIVKKTHDDLKNLDKNIYENLHKKSVAFYDKVITETTKSLCLFASECEKIDDIKELLFQIHEESRKSIINASYDNKKNTLVHVIFKKYSDEVNEYDDLVKELKKDNIDENKIDFDETEKIIKEYETLIQFLIQMGGNIEDKNDDNITPYDLLVNGAKNRIHKTLQTILINYIIENDGQKFYEILLKLYYLGEATKILNNNDAIINAIKKDTNASILFFCVEYGITTNIKNLHNKTIIDYLIDKNDSLDSFFGGRLSAKLYTLIEKAIKQDGQELFDYALQHIDKTYWYDKKDILGLALNSEWRYYTQKLVDTKAFREEELLKALKNWLRYAKNHTFNSFMSRNFMLKVDVKKHAKELLASYLTNPFAEWELTKYLLDHINKLGSINDETKKIIIKK